MDNSDIDARSRLEAVLRFKVDNISKLRVGDVLSEPTFAGNFPWRIRVKACKERNKKIALGFFLHCDGGADKPNWSCRAKATMKIMSQEPGTEPFQRKFDHTFHSGEYDWGYAKFITWDQLFDLGWYVKNDSVTMEVHVKVDDPAQSKATLNFRVKSLAILKADHSMPVYVRNIPWRIKVVGHYQPNKIKSLGIFLQCYGNRENPNWSCGAVATMRIMPQNPEGVPFQRKIRHIFHPTENDWGYSTFIDWQELIDPSKGFLNNDSIEVEIDVKANTPQIENGTNNEGLNVSSRYLECPICLELPRREVYQCISGHTICDNCINGVTTCPQCRQILGDERIRNRAVETMLDDVEMGCSYTGNGCNFKALRKRLPQHELDCVFGAD